MFLHTQAMIYAIEEISQCTPSLLPNLTLGYEIYDTCGDVSLAIRETLQLMKDQTDTQSCPLPESLISSLTQPQIKVVVDERYSEVSTAVAQLLAYQLFRLVFSVFESAYSAKNDNIDFNMCTNKTNMLLNLHVYWHCLCFFYRLVMHQPVSCSAINLSSPLHTQYYWYFCFSLDLWDGPV